MIFVKAYITEMSAVMSALIGLVMMRLGEIEMVHITIMVVNAKNPLLCCRIDRAIELIHSQKTTVLGS